MLSVLDANELASKVKVVDINNEDLPVERALGVKWNVDSDVFGYQSVLKRCPYTHRGMLSIVSSISDPLGFLSPFILLVKRMVQEACKLKFGWDEELPPVFCTVLQKWLDDLPMLSDVKIWRC